MGVRENTSNLPLLKKGPRDVARTLFSVAHLNIYLCTINRQASKQQAVPVMLLWRSRAVLGRSIPPKMGRVMSDVPVASLLCTTYYTNIAEIYRQPAINTSTHHK